MGRKYNFIYRQLVPLGNEEHDMIGYIAYCLYKADKEAYIENFKKIYDDKELTEEDLHCFHEMSCLNTVLSRYRINAELVLQEFINTTLQQSFTEINDICENRQREILKDVIAPIKPKSKVVRYGEGILQSIAGAFVFALILAALGFINVFKEENYYKYIYEKFENEELIYDINRAALNDYLKTNQRDTII